MASFSDNADWGADCSDAPAKYPNDGSDYCGDDTAEIYRVNNIFTISTLPVTDTVDQVDYDIYVSSVQGVTTKAWSLGAYNGDGQADPEADTAQQAFDRADVSADYYLTGLTDYRTTGQKTHTNLGSTANSDVEAARDAGTTFAIAIKMDGESTANNARCEFREYTDGSTPPKITITHSAAAAGAGKSNPLYGPLGGPLAGPIG